MTVKHKDSDKATVVDWDWATKNYRLIVLILVLSATPFGQQLLYKTLGIAAPAAQEGAAAQNDIKVIREEFAAFRAEFRRELADVKTATDQLRFRFDGFSSDLDTLKKQRSGSNSAPLQPN